MDRPGDGRRPRVALLASMVAGLVGCDHATKVAAESALRDGRQVTVVPGWIDLRLTENDDVAFNALSRLSLHLPAWVLTIFAVVAVAAVAFASWRRRPSPVAACAYALIVAGAIGNAADRMLRGRVVDFIHLRSWPVFNVADIAVVAGVMLLFLERRGARESTDSV
jgi:signal peptidase II